MLPPLLLLLPPPLLRLLKPELPHCPRACGAGLHTASTACSWTRAPPSCSWRSMPSSSSPTPPHRPWGPRRWCERAGGAPEQDHAHSSWHAALPSQAPALSALWWGEFRLAHWQPCLPLPHLPTNSNRIGLYLVFRPQHPDPLGPPLAVFKCRARACRHQCMLAGAEGAAADVSPRFTFLGVLRSMSYPPLASARVISHVVFNLQAGWRLAGLPHTHPHWQHFDVDPCSSRHYINACTHDMHESWQPPLKCAG